MRVRMSMLDLLPASYRAFVGNPELGAGSS